MNVQEKEIAKMNSEITREVRAIFKKNMKVFDWDIPENDDKISAGLILSVMQRAMDDLKDEVAAGKFDNY
ncbi:MAG: hypothetical protein U9Q90_11430 [Campylobacterota bacterium]|nr:hypothetical protein [Campylobacterota bacterium]